MFRTSLIGLLLISSVSAASAGFPGFNPGPILEGEPVLGLPPVEQPLITKSNSSGFVMADWIRSETCEVFADRVVITKNFGLEYAVTETRLINLVGDLPALLAKAAAETLTEKENFLCDAPGSFISAGAGLLPEEIVLFSSGGCGSPKQVREGSASRILTDIILGYCPKMNDFGGEF